MSHVKQLTLQAKGHKNVSECWCFQVSFIDFSMCYCGLTPARYITSGVPTAIISPDGIRTELTIDANNHLTQITYPDGNYYGFECTPDGLMTAKIDPDGNRFEHDFDSFGRLTNADDEESGHWNYTRTATVLFIDRRQDCSRVAFDFTVFLNFKILSLCHV